MSDLDLFSDWLATINYKSKDLFEEHGEEVESEYEAFMINKAMSLHEDTIHHANLMNRYYDLPAKMQYHFYWHAVPRKKRFAQWPKKTKSNLIKMIMEAYGYNRQHAEEIAIHFKPEDEEALEVYLSKGGRKGGKDK